MLKSKTFLGVDFGAGSLKAAEFETAEDGGLRLRAFGVKSLGLAGSQDAQREAVLKKSLGDLLGEAGLSARDASISIPGYQVFSKFVKLPPVDTSKVSQIIEYEAKQNVPFPLTEAAWDRQILGNTASGEVEVVLLAVKSAEVEKYFGICEGGGLKLSVVDASLAALANAFRYNYPDLEGCSLLIDIGAKTSNVLVFEKNKFYARSIPVGSNAITQEFGAEVKLPFPEAEKIKTNGGFVSLGGAYEEPDDPKLAAVSKVARNVLTRLHLQVNQTIQFYRTQQGGAAPVRLFLCGGGSVLPYSTEFFQEKLNLPVEYFNPFRNVQIAAGVDVEALEKVAPSLGEVVGLGLRSIVQCPMELNLMPKASLSRQQFNAKKPLLLAAAFAAAAGVFGFGAYFSKKADATAEVINKVQENLTPLETALTTLQSEQSKVTALTNKTAQLAGWLQGRVAWPELALELKRVVVQAEANSESKLARPVSLWIETLSDPIFGPTVTAATTETSSSEEPTEKPLLARIDPALAARYGLKVTPTPAATEDGDGGGAPKAKGSVSTNQIVTLNLVIKGIMASPNDESQTATMYDFQSVAKASEFFDKEGTELTGKVEKAEDSFVFSFPIKIKLKRPIQL